MVNSPFLVRTYRALGVPCDKCQVDSAMAMYKVASSKRSKAVPTISCEEYTSWGEPYYVGFWCIDCMRAEGLLW